MILKRGVLFVFLALVLSGPASAADFQAGLEAAERGDYATALKEWRPLAERGDTFAQYNLGRMYYYAKGVTQDYAAAVQWFRLAAEQGDALAQYNLGVMYGNKNGVSQDYVQAHMWLNIAASHLPPGEVRDLAVNNRDLVEKQMTPEQIAEAQRLASEWKSK